MNTPNPSFRLPALFISHGSPMTALEPGRVGERLADLRRSLPRPRAIVVASAHWLARSPLVGGAAQPETIHDFGGFPQALFDLRYPAPGEPALARRVADLLARAGLDPALDPRRGLDHGVWVPLSLLYPRADIPVVPVSIQPALGPAHALAIGRALAPLRDEGVLILGSGLSYHNLRLFGPEAKVPSEAFDAWLAETLALPAAQRTERLIHWEEAPYARVCHKEEDHFVPLFAALGAAEGEAATMVYHDTDLFGGVTASSYRFG